MSICSRIPSPYEKLQYIFLDKFFQVSETKSLNWYVMVFKALTYKKYLPKIMRWLRTKQYVWQWIISNIISFWQQQFRITRDHVPLLESIPKRSCVHAVYKQMLQGLTLRRTKGQEGEATFFTLCNKLFVGKIRWMILYWNIINLISLVALNGRR